LSRRPQLRCASRGRNRPRGSADRECWIDNSTDPVTVWYTDHDGWIVRLQPLD